MSSDEDFSLVMDNPQQSKDTLEGIQALINKYKKQYGQLIEEQHELSAARDELRKLAGEFKQRTEKLVKSTKLDQESFHEQYGNKKAEMMSLKQEINHLEMEFQRVQEALEEEEATNQRLREKCDVFSAVPEKELVFKGLTINADDTQKFEMKSRIVYPMTGGTALVTFEEEDVANNILQIKMHRVGLGEECRINVEARPVTLMVPCLVEINSEICPRRILLSNLPKMDTETMLNKLEIHFSKRKNGGGEVESCEMMPDSRTVVIAFLENDIAQNLTDTEYHEVMLSKTKHRVRATPFLNGMITNLETKMSTSSRTLLLTGIPDVMEPDILQDLLEIHFQKNSNGGGEIEAFLYCPLGEQTSAVFEGISPKTEK